MEAFPLFYVYIGTYINGDVFTPPLFFKDMHKSSNKYLTIIWTLVCIVFIIINVEDLIRFLHYPSEYPIGTEWLYWKYASENAYIAESILMIIWFSIPCIMCIRTKGHIKWKWLVPHILLTLAYQTYILMQTYNL